MLGRNLRAAREAAGLTQSAGARAIGITPHKLWRYESGRMRPPLEMLEQMAAAYACTLDCLVRGDHVSTVDDTSEKNLVRS